MKSLIQARWLFIKKYPLALCFWLLFPIAATSCFMQLAGTAQTETRIPVALVIQDSSPAVRGLEQSMQRHPLLRVTLLEEEAAFDSFRSYKYDSLFIIPDDFSKNIAAGKTKGLIQAYHSDRSLFFEPVKEMMVANVQAASGRMQAALTVQKLSEKLTNSPGWSTDEIIKTANDIEQEQHLLQTDFQFRGTPEKTDHALLLNPLLPWSAAALIATFFLFDFITKERKEEAFARLYFSRYSVRPFILISVLLYTIILFVFDLTAALLFSNVLDYKLIISLIGFRLIASSLALALALLVRNAPLHYALSLLIVSLLVITSGNQGLFSGLNPVSAFVNEKTGMLPLAIMLVMLAIILKRKEFSRA
ncbi:ABC transporter permease [Aciduricibacillus chroicocephali]|uniref:ABC transporter permease n=1 Tax=Aciduricibacillus chroicocephali TaxID=3054939 RepID=A0ABY9KS52_9BACI|nr:ABC transporter permease [Bacillaceae bacterium 44XB]